MLSQQLDYCAQDEISNYVLKNQRLRDEFLKKQKQLSREDSVRNGSCFAKLASQANYTIPIVFHILHQNGSENISDAQIYDEINILNRDYRKLNADTASIVPPFSAADAKFEFRLATKDTNGNCTTGIVRHFDPHTYFATGTPTAYTQFKYTWNTNTTKYLNVYVVASIPGGAGFSSFPGMNPGFADVIVIKHNYIGSIGTSNVVKSRALTHEVGHFFNLQHVWGSGAPGITCGDDGVNDTPITKGFNTCPGSPPANCNPPMIENYQNYMEYSYCTRMFTAGQVSRMTTAINSTVSGRNTLWSNSNLVNTGVSNPVGPCVPIPYDYAASNIYTVCMGRPINFFDASSNGTVTSWTWTASGNPTLSASNSSSTSITFGSPGIQTVVLNVANNIGSSAYTNTVLVINAQADVSVNYPESFENTGLPMYFSVSNPDMDVTWSQTSLCAATGTNCYYINGASDAPASKPDILETPSYDFSQDPNSTFTFKYAYAKYNNSNTDVFKVLASSDCGATWVNIYEPTNFVLASGSGGVSNVPFTPTSNQFVTYTLSDHPNFFPFLGQPYVKIRFSFKEDTLAGYGNNIFLDDINFNSTNTAGMTSFSKSFGCALFPNPSSGKNTLQIDLSDPSEIEYAVYSSIGENLFAETKKFSAGQQLISINEDEMLKPGLYFLTLSINKQQVIKKLIIAEK